MDTYQILILLPVLGIMPYHTAAVNVVIFTPVQRYSILSWKLPMPQPSAGRLSGSNILSLPLGLFHIWIVHSSSSLRKKQIILLPLVLLESLQHLPVTDLAEE
jgi:hypothetical protein